MILKSRFVVPVGEPVIQHGAIRIHNGRIVEVGRAADISGDASIDYADAVICPAFVNAHTHLELSNLHGRVPPSPDFTDWLRRLVEAKSVEPPTKEQIQSAVEEGIEQSLAAGVTTVGDITHVPAWTRESLAQSAIRAVSYGEVIAIGTRRNLLDQRLSAAADRSWETARLRIGISPHAPYTVEPDGLRACAERAAEQKAPLCMHLAETADEERFTGERTGTLADYLRDLGVWDDAIPLAGCGPTELADRTGVLGATTVVAHANYVSDGDITLLAKSGASVAYCPRTHDAFGHPRHRFRDMLQAGVNVCVGTDSLASNPSLSVLDELRFLRRARPDVAAEELLAMGTLHGARGLGFADEIGSITIGKLADLAVIPLGSGVEEPRWDRMLDNNTAPIAVYISGIRRRSAG
ncbi:MAG: amidohydrolase family protein [Planctomycetes bacterium]|nr:amidohydrolase family protein [Planctomycetota bacterium]